jgi:glycosyltransferase involved in cell wall biosynthesis
VVPNTVSISYRENSVFNHVILEKFKNNFVLLYLGDTGLRRGLETSIEVISILQEKIPTIKLVIVGSNSSDVVLKKKVVELGIQNFVDFEGWQNESLFPSYIKASSICISPLHRNLHHDTTYANKLFQYMSFAKPVLVSDAIAQKNLIERTNSGLVHLEKNAHDFADKVLQLYNDEALCVRLGQNGKQFVEEEFCWEKTSEKLIALYANLSK